jgi:GDPmannose 4,6-dehydratase
MPTAIITGITGQDGSYLSDILLEKGYKVVGLSRRRSGGGDGRIKHLQENPNFVLEFGDVTDSGSLHRVIEKYGPNEFYNLAAQSFVGLSWSEPVHTANATAIGVLNCLEAIRNVKKDTKFYQASSSEMFGKVVETPQSETTPFHPRSPYGVAKVFGYWITRNYRESYGMFATNGILFNHESPRRGTEFVTKKITKAAAQIYISTGGKLSLGNLDSVRDWGHARDYMEAAYLMLQQKEPDDFVISTGVGHTIKDLLDTAFGYLNLDWRKYVVQDPQFMRPAEVDLLLGDSTKAREKLGWKPKYNFKSLIEEMVDKDLLDISPNHYYQLSDRKFRNG